MRERQPLIEIDAVMSRLAERRSMFCSEADFQHELAYETRRDDPGLDVRPEHSDRPGRAIAAPARSSSNPLTIMRL